MERLKAFSNTCCPHKFCCFSNLEIGLKIFGALESLFWVLLAVVSIYSEVQCATNTRDLFYLSGFLEEDWFYHLTFDDLRESIDGSWISKNKKQMATEI